MGSGESVYDEQEHRAAGVTESGDFPSVSLCRLTFGTPYVLAC